MGVYNGRRRVRRSDAKAKDVPTAVPSWGFWHAEVHISPETRLLERLYQHVDEHPKGLDTYRTKPKPTKELRTIQWLVT